MSASTSVHSNAFNFTSFMNNGVDPRTGQYTQSISLPELQSHLLNGPVIPISLDFNPLNTLDSGYGLGWNLRLSQYTPHNQVITLNTGESFKVTSSGDEPDIEEKKLDTFHFYDEGNDRYRIVHKSGQVEILQTGGSGDNRVALPVQIYSAQGYQVDLTYVPFQGGQLLSSIVEKQGPTLLQVVRSTNEVELRLFPGQAGEALYLLHLTGGKVMAITLPGETQPSWRFYYGDSIRGLNCLRTVHNPTGGVETIEYRDEGHIFPSTAGRAALPRVTHHTTEPGFGQPETKVTYLYNDHLNHNFLGNGASLSWSNDVDNLYNAPHTYFYGSTETLLVGTREVRTVKRTYNRFHLLTEEVTTQGDCRQTVETTYYAEDKPFALQPPQCQLPKEVKSSWSLVSTPSRYRSEIQTTAYDDFGNLTEQVDINGVRSVHEYFDKPGVPGECPKDPEDFVRNLRHTTVYPASATGTQAPTLRTAFRYIALAALTNSGRNLSLVPSQERLLEMNGAAETELQSTLLEYFDTPGDSRLHGRLARREQTRNGQRLETAYAYSTPESRLAGEPVLQTVETLTGFDGEQKVITLQRSLTRGEPVLERDDNDVEILRRYDRLGRVTSETVAPNSDEFRATRHYRYVLVAMDGQQAEQVVTDVKGVETRSLFDGLNRIIREERQNADSQSGARDFRTTYSAGYDELGNLARETQVDWLGSRDLELSSHYQYDDWGQQLCVTNPLGVKEYSQIDPIGNADHNGTIQTVWQEGSGSNPLKSGKTVAWLDRFDKPVRVERLGLDERTVSLHEYVQDGLGRTIEDIDGRNARTQYRYDAFDRLEQSTLPEGAEVLREYAAHSTEDLPIKISVDSVVLGEQSFDGLDRKIGSVTGGRVQEYVYDPGQNQPKTVTVPSGESIDYEYQPQLGEEPLMRRLPSGEADYHYDNANARLLWCEEAGQKLTREYFSTGELKSESLVQGGESHAMHYDYSRLGLLRSYVDVLGQTQSYDYDERTGQLKQTALGTTTSTFSYDGLGRTRSIHTRDSASGQQVRITLEYDEFSRETQRTFDLDGVEQTLTQAYDAVDALVTRSLSQGSTQLRSEQYEYDLNGRLQIYDCAGSQPPQDPYGNPISQQVFRFDALDNITRVVTTAVGGEINRADYHYQNPDPAQLSKVLNSNPGMGYPSQIELTYDLNGNLTTDEQGRTLEYDALNRLLSVSAPDGGAPRGYAYDPLDQLSRQEEGGNSQQRFYRDGELANTLGPRQNRTFMRGGDSVLAERQDSATRLLATTLGNSVISELGQGATHQDMAYNAYGHRSAGEAASATLGFNGELREDVNECYLLGNGYRVYSPGLMRFQSPDSISPFEQGGVNAYAYCGGDPVNRTDPSGHFSFTAIGSLLALIGGGLIVSSFAVKGKGTKTVLASVGGVMLFAGLGAIGMGAFQARGNFGSGRTGGVVRQAASRSNQRQAYQARAIENARQDLESLRYLERQAANQTAPVATVQTATIPLSPLAGQAGAYVDVGRRISVTSMLEPVPGPVTPGPVTSAPRPPMPLPPQETNAVTVVRRST
ncbi:RHS repeat-associated core domain-containing protein [Pseudomonas batumici]|uniref:RHS repeat domain-containing protein n=1 Tax=Pseudomonas batumici TaxID=226910 RepID=UPI0030D0A674